MLFETEAFQLFSTLVNDVIVYAFRPDVLWQVGLGIAVWLISTVLWRLLKRALTARLPVQDRVVGDRVVGDRVGWRKWMMRWFNELWQCVTQPGITLLLLAVIIQLRTRQNSVTGLLVEFAGIILVYLLMQVVIVTLNTVSNHALIRRFSTQFLRPLFALFVVWRLMSRLVNIETLLTSELITLFGSPVTVAAALIATVGLYLWIVGVTLLDDGVIAVLSRRREEIGSAKGTLTIVRYVLIIVGIGIAISQLNFNATTIAAITGGLSVGIGFALSTILSNFISGLILLFERSIQPGDVIEVDDKLSIVEDVSMRAMRVRTLNNIEVVIPNETFISSHFTTYTGSDKRIRVQVPVGASYDDDPDAVQRVLHQIAHDHPQVLDNPAPNVQLVAFGDSSIDYLVNVWLASPLHRPKTISDLNFAIYKAFAKHGFSIPFPQRDIHIIQSGSSDAIGG